MDVIERDAGEFGLHARPSLKKRGAQDDFDARGDGAIVVGQKPFESVAGLGIDRAVNVLKSDIPWSIGQAEATFHSLMTGDGTRLYECRKKPANNDGIRVRPVGHLGGSDRGAGLMGEICEDVNADGETIVSGHRTI